MAGYARYRDRAAQVIADHLGERFNGTHGSWPLRGAILGRHPFASRRIGAVRWRSTPHRAGAQGRKRSSIARQNDGTWPQSIALYSQIVVDHARGCTIVDVDE
jgi:hypothetical protein